MIKQVIKRNGTKQDFNPDKLNGWGIWAAKTLGNIDWGQIVLETHNRCNEVETTQNLQQMLIRTCLEKKSFAYNRMAGRLYVSMLYKEIFNGKLPTIYELHKRLVEQGVLCDEFFNAYTIDDYNEIEKIIKHSRDLRYAYYQLHQITKKYALQNKPEKIVYETPQFVFMRVSMALAQNLENRLLHIAKFYEFFSKNKINVPTPYFTNAGTPKDSYLSCCVYKTDDNIMSLATGDHIAYMMTANSSGIGANIVTRAEGQPIRGGIISHQGKLPYYKSVAGAINANMQNGRGGACTVTFTVFDPQVQTILKLKNPRSPDSLRNRDLDYSMAINDFFLRKVAKNEDYHTFSIDTAPDVFNAMHLDTDEFEQVYNKAVKEKRFISILNARQVMNDFLSESMNTGRIYSINLTTMNHHTPFTEPITQSNLCQEIALPTKAYSHISDLYDDMAIDEENGEVGMCALAGIVLPNIKTDEEYAEVAYYSLLMVTVAIQKTKHYFPQVKHTSIARNSAGISIVGLAHYMAKNMLSYATKDGRQKMHEIAETHYWHLLNASLKLSQEYQVCEWIDKTKWKQGWLPIDTYSREVDKYAEPIYKRDWESLRQRIVENGGIAHSVLVAHAPTESSSLSSGTTNGLYPIRDIYLLKTNDTSSVTYVVPDSDKLQYYYENVWTDLTIQDLMITYAIFQKFTDQAISADMFFDLSKTDKISSVELLKIVLQWNKLGIKTRYYVNSRIGIQNTSQCENCSI